MPLRTKTEIAIELVNVRGEIDRVATDIKDASWEIQEVLARKMAAESIVSGNFGKDEKVVAQQQCHEICIQLAGLYRKQDRREQDLDNLKRKETRLSSQLQSAN
ncbi:hypothetical protein FOXG_20835 [Fusarium oxysporum f. sp. lycopersici 4287]|uniref:Uncharacterized protein n=1 Tax=Fusarium oxysporum f. sp. lycopersici (strain 4287 / CBS 123668 / FGSC 9935 / NRRL 34936) TaxID=426428 RepID=A0A0J9VRA7_FUSO4|nr:hypothetical protein FOXG_20835 [Fusarium oxysporum f. sp. lycopersici 4287]KNB13529.1 hypothetical protein FOXG_20835 [Fusarium oxysporum f. sp. lycopersici 4287]